MRQAQQLAHLAGENEDVPVGALVLDSTGKVIGQGFNTRERDKDPVGHAEINALRQASQSLDTWNLSGCTLVVTLEPCTMCAGAIINARISRVVFGAWEEKTGAAGSIRDVLRDSRLPHQVEVVSGVLAEQISEDLRNWFVKKLR